MPVRTGVKVEAEFPVPLEQAWRFFSDYAGMPNACDGVHDVTVTGSGIGMVRHVPVGDRFTDEELRVMDHENHRIVYGIVAKSPDVAMEDYEAEMKLTPRGEGACGFAWESRFAVADDLDAEAVRANLRDAYESALNGFRKALSAGA